MQFEMGFSTRRQPQRSDTTEDGRTMHVLVAADFSGRAARGARDTLAGRHTYHVDSDTREAVLAGFECRLQIPMAWAPGGTLELGFESLEDFHPDSFLARVPVLAEIVSCRRALDAPATASAVLRLQQLLGAAPPAETLRAPTALITPESTEDTLARLMGGPPATAATPAPAAPQVDSLIRHIVSTSSSVAASEPTGKSALVAAAELALAERLREILHHPTFKALEAAWRGLDFLVRRCPDEERVHIHACDATSDEIAADPAGLARLLRSQPVDLLVIDATFGQSPADLTELGTIADTCATAGATLATGASSVLVGCDNFAAHPDPDDWTFGPSADVRAAWAAYRALPQARSAVLATPRYLSRQAYGKAGDAIETLPFEELPSPARHEMFSWTNPAFVVALALAGQFAASEDGGHPDGAIELGDFPVARHLAHGGTAIMPCAEAWLSDRAVGRLLGAGLTALQAVHHSDTIRLHLAE